MKNNKLKKEINLLNKLGLDKKDFISVFHKNNVLSSINNSILPKGYVLGNSIAQGTGSSSYGKTIPYQIGIYLQSIGNNFTINDYASTGLGVGGCTTATILSYLADNYISPNSSDLIKKADYCVCITMKNDISKFSLNQYRLHLELLVSLIKNQNLDFFYVLDPPTTSNGKVINFVEHSKYCNIAKSVLTQNGISFVDCFNYFSRLGEIKGDLSSLYSSDGVHLSDSGYLEMTDLIVTALISPSKAQIVTKTDLKNTCISVFDNSSNLIPSLFAGLTTSSTSRKIKTNEDSNLCYPLTVGQKITFESKCPTLGVIVHFVSPSGEIKLKFAGVDIPLNMNSFSTFARESSVSYFFPNNFLKYRKLGTLEIECITPVSITGVTFIAEKEISSLETQPILGFSQSIFYDNSICQIISNTESRKFDFFGNSITFDYQCSTSGGKIEIYLDNVLYSVLDSYVNASTKKYVYIINAIENGFHTIELKGVAKNVNSSSDQFKIGNYKYFTKYPHKTKYSFMKDGQTYDFRENIENSLRIAGLSSGIYYKNKVGTVFKLETNDVSGFSLIET